MTRRHTARLLRDTSGAMALEFAIAAPAFFVMLLGVFQAAVWLQNYNSVRSVASDVARSVLVEYQRENPMTNEQIEARAISMAVGAPYLLNGESLSVDVSRPGSRVAGADEISVALTYTPPNFLPLASLAQFDIEYNRPIFVVEPGS